MDHGAAGDARADAPQRRARPGRGRPGPVPGHEARHRAGHRRRLLLRLPAAATADPGRPAGHRGADARVDRRRPPVRVQRGDARRPRRAALVERDQPFKVEIVDDLAAAAERDGTPMPPTTFYRQGPFIDLCRGPHVASTGKIGPFKLLGTAGAYWRGDEKRPMLQRVYGTAWATQEELDAYLWRREEAKKRDHRRLGVALDLYSFHDVSPGSAFWHPKGQRIWRTLEGAMRELQDAPRLPGGLDADPRVASGSGASPATGTSTATTCSSSSPRSRLFSLKPMNCPESTYIYRARTALVPRPAAALQRVRPAAPQRALRARCQGLTRVRQFIQDDAHIYVRPDQLADELEALLGEIHEAYVVGRPDAALRVRDEAGQGGRRSRRCGSRPSGSSRRRSTGRPHAATRSSPRTARSTRPRSTSTSTTRSAASGRWRRSRST